MKVVDERENVFRRRFDANRTLDTEGVGIGRNIQEQRGERHEAHEDNCLEHRFPRKRSDLTGWPPAEAHGDYFLADTCARTRSSRSLSSGVNSAPNSSAANTWRTALSQSAL